MKRPNEDKSDMWLSMVHCFDGVVAVYVWLPCGLPSFKQSM